MPKKKEKKKKKEFLCGALIKRIGKSIENDIVARVLVTFIIT